jgi:CheY-like chemotaxis protein
MINSGTIDPSPKRILVVEDEPGMRAVVAETLRGEGYVVDEAGDGAEGLGRLRLARPDLILLDLAMPGLDGHGFLEQRRAEPAARDIPIVIVSATPMLAEEPRDAGVMAMLLKPFDLGALLAMVDWYAHDHPVQTNSG